MASKTLKKPAQNVFTLEVPVEWDGETIETIAWRKPKGRDMRKMTNLIGRDRGNIGDATVKMMADLCEMPEEFFDELDGGDWTRLSQEISGFLDPALRT